MWAAVARAPTGRVSPRRSAPFPRRARPSRPGRFLQRIGIVRTTSTQRGFTFIELVITVAVIAILSWLAVSNLWRLKPRADLAGATGELAALLHQARQTALGDGKPVAVLFYPSYAQKIDGHTSTGYVIVYEDTCPSGFFSVTPCGGLGFSTYDPAKLAGTGMDGNSAVLDTLTLPMNIVFASAAEMANAPALPKPFDRVPVDVACSFCGTTAGAVQFDARGQVTFYKLDGTSQTGPLTDLGGYSVSLGFNPTTAPIPGHRTILILSGSGAVQTIVGG